MRNSNIILDKMAIYFSRYVFSFSSFPLRSISFHYTSIHFHFHSLEWWLFFHFHPIRWFGLFAWFLFLFTFELEHTVQCLYCISYKNVRLHALRIFTLNAMLLYFVFIVRWFVFPLKRSQRSGCNASTNICGMSMRVRVFINTISQEVDSKSLNLKSKIATEVKIYYLFTHNTTEIKLPARPHW